MTSPRFESKDHEHSESRSDRAVLPSSFNLVRSTACRDTCVGLGYGTRLGVASSNSRRFPDRLFSSASFRVKTSCQFRAVLQSEDILPIQSDPFSSQPIPVSGSNQVRHRLTAKVRVRHPNRELSAVMIGHYLTLTLVSILSSEMLSTAEWSATTSISDSSR